MRATRSCSKKTTARGRTLWIVAGLGLLVAITALGCRGHGFMRPTPERIHAFITWKVTLASGEPGAPGFVLRAEPVAPAEVIAAAASRFAERHPEHPLEVHADGALPTLEADPALLRRVLDNLLDNAAKYGTPAPAPIELTARAETSGVVWEVRDRGIGIADDDRERIFEPFFRTDRSRGRDTGGIGLGLTLCRRIVEAHGGHLVAEPRVGGGAVFRVSLPTA